jgi:hypothetical protein
MADKHSIAHKQDVVAELNHLDISRMGGLGITRKQLEAWLNLRSSGKQAAMETTGLSSADCPDIVWIFRKPGADSLDGVRRMLR